MIAVGFVGLLLGVVIASLLLDIPLPEEWAAYMSLAALAGSTRRSEVGAPRWRDASTLMYSCRGLS